MPRWCCCLYPAGAWSRRPQPGSRLAAGHPEGCGLDRGEDGAIVVRREQIGRS
ncbi:MAG: hypothetical protein QOH91_4568 [Mycobacterium sp.]|nr:hypothetical protein [Mycobacterium sp.]